MAQFQSGRGERIARSLRRLDHRLEQRGRGYVIANTGGTIVHPRAVLSLDEVEAWIKDYIKPWI